MTAIAINDRRHAYRAANLRTLIAALREQELSRDEMSNLIGKSKSATREYVVILGSLLDSSMGDAGQAYRLTSDEKRVQTFLAKLGDGPGRRKTGGARSMLAAAMSDPSRHFHIAADDMPFKVKLQRGPVKADPWALPAGFFRSEVRV
jgi:hypothetical protein